MKWVFNMEKDIYFGPDSSEKLVRPMVIMNTSIAGYIGIGLLLTDLFVLGPDTDDEVIRKTFNTRLVELLKCIPKRQLEGIISGIEVNFPSNKINESINQCTQLRLHIAALIQETVTENITKNSNE